MISSSICKYDPTAAPSALAESTISFVAEFDRCPAMLIAEAVGPLAAEAEAAPQVTAAGSCPPVSDLKHSHAPLIPPEIRHIQHTDSELYEAHLRSERSLMYVAASRAMQKLAITGVGEPSPYLEIG